MNEKRDYSLDWIRVIAMFGVVFDHYICNIGHKVLNNIGLQMGGSVTMFFVISALLFGTRWAKDNYVGFQPKVFLKKRCSRIFIPLWITLLLVIPIEYVVAQKLVPSTIIMNAIGLNWARPFGTAGHLWYITMLMILYVCFVGISWLRLDRIKWYWWLGSFAALVVSYFILQNRLTTYSKAGPPLFIFFSVLMFTRGKDVLEIAKKKKTSGDCSNYRYGCSFAICVSVRMAQFAQGACNRFVHLCRNPIVPFIDLLLEDN